MIKQINALKTKLTQNENPHTPVAQEIADEVLFRRFQGEGVEFFQIEPH